MNFISLSIFNYSRHFQYAKYKSRCVKETTPSDTPPTKIRKRIDCSIVDESMMSEEEYSDFKKHCNVKVTTDRYRPGENIILTKKVKIRTGKEKFSCYDQDVDRMTDEEYSEFEKKCLTHPLFRYDCSTVDTTNLSRDEVSIQIIDITFLFPLLVLHPALTA